MNSSGLSAVPLYLTPPWITMTRWDGDDDDDVAGSVDSWRWWVARTTKVISRLKNMGTAWCGTYANRTWALWLHSLWNMHYLPVLGQKFSVKI